MAKYIDLDKIEFLKVEDNKEFNHGVDCCINKLLEIEPVDVIERVKIDNALKEMDDLAAHKVKPISFDQSVAIDMCIGILKRNIRGE